MCRVLFGASFAPLASHVTVSQARPALEYRLSLPSPDSTLNTNKWMKNLQTSPSWDPPKQLRDRLAPFPHVNSKGFSACPPTDRTLRPRCVGTCGAWEWQAKLGLCLPCSRTQTESIYIQRESRYTNKFASMMFYDNMASPPNCNSVTNTCTYTSGHAHVETGLLWYVQKNPILVDEKSCSIASMLKEDFICTNGTFNHLRTKGACLRGIL